LRKKEKIINFRPSEKNLLYLSKLGYLDGRTNYKKSDHLNISEFINGCISLVLESERSGVGSLASSKDLKLAWLRFQISESVRENNKIIDRIVLLQRERDGVLAVREECLLFD